MSARPWSLHRLANFCTYGSEEKMPLPTANQEAVRKWKAWHNFGNAGVPTPLCSLTQNPAPSASDHGQAVLQNLLISPQILHQPLLFSSFSLSYFICSLFSLPCYILPVTCSKFPLAHPPKAD